MKHLHMLLVFLGASCVEVTDPGTNQEDVDVPVPEASGVPVQVTEESFPTCTSPSSDGGFLDVSEISGITAETSSFMGISGQGAVLADLDQDGWPDFFFPQMSGVHELFWNEEGVFVRAPEERQPVPTDNPAGAASSADVDGDGDLDLLVVGMFSLQLLRNEGGRLFVDVSEDVGFTADLAYRHGAAWADVDGDEDLDVLVSQDTSDVAWFMGQSDADLPQPTVNALWMNEDGVLRREDSSDLAQEPGATLHSAFYDIDHDGDPDLFEVNDHGHLFSSRLWENLGALEDGVVRWRDRFAETTIGWLAAPMGLAITDLDRDGVEDLWFSDIGPNRLFQGQGDWQYVETSLDWLDQSEQAYDDVSWSVVEVDVDGDGRQEFFVSYGVTPYPAANIPNRTNQPFRLYADVAELGASSVFVQDPRVPEVPRDSYGVAPGDVNRDGVVDLLIVHKSGRPTLLQGQCTDKARVAVDLHDPTSGNTFAVGAVVAVEAGDMHQRQEVEAGSHGSFSAADPTLFFGLGHTSKIQQMVITWPDGSQSQIPNLCVNCRLLITREE